MFSGGGGGVERGRVLLGWFINYIPSVWGGGGRDDWFQDPQEYQNLRMLKSLI